MATVSRLRAGIEQQFLRCPICLGAYSNPRYLPCNHVCCSDCLSRLIAGKRGLNCPMCTAYTQVPENGINGFPTAFHQNSLQAFMENVEPPQQVVDKASQTHDTFCRQHPTYRLKHYCENDTCHIPVCLLCCRHYHSQHKTIDIEQVSQNHRSRENELLLEDSMTSENVLKKRGKEIKDEINKSNWEFDKNKKLIHDRYLKMIEDLQKQEKKLIKKAEKSRDDKVKYYELQLVTTDKKLSSFQNARAILADNTMPNYASGGINQLQGELLQNAKRTLEETISPELSIKRTEVTIAGEFLVDMKMGIDDKSCKSIPCLDGGLTSLVLFDGFLIAWDWNVTSTSFFVYGSNTKKARHIKRKLKKWCPYAYRMVSMRTDGKEVLLVTEAAKSVGNHIKILYIDEDQFETIHMDNNIHPCALAVDRQNELIFTDFGQRLFIRKLTRKGDILTIYENKDGAGVLQNPWHICVNVNDDIIVSDCEKKSLIILDAKGNVISTYYGFSQGAYSNPCGICTDGQGNIFVCDYYGHCIHKLDKHGRFLDFAVTQSDGLEHPEALAYNFSNGHLVIGQSDGNIKY